MARTWLIDGRGFAEKVKNAGRPASCQIEDCGANLECPNYQCVIDNSDVSHDWPGLPAGVKFEPSDVELLEHLAAKCGSSGSQPHMFIDEFIPTLEGDEGICYTHPKNLPAKKDGSSVHFFYKMTNAYTTGQRKRRRVHDQENIIKMHVRWHKTGKTKPVMENGIQKGFKKIMVLYTASKGGSKPDKCNWVLHEYHTNNKDEKGSEFVVAKIFYNPQKESERDESFLANKECDIGTHVQVVPRTPNTNTQELSRHEKTPMSDGGSNDYNIQLQETKKLKLQFDPPSSYPLEGQTENATNTDDFKPNNASSTQVGDLQQSEGSDNASCGLDDLDKLMLDAPPDFYLNDMQYDSEDNLFDWLDRL